jgi:hypothetical protein
MVVHAWDHEHGFGAWLCMVCTLGACLKLAGITPTMGWKANLGRILESKPAGHEARETARG